MTSKDTLKKICTSKLSIIVLSALLGVVCIVFSAVSGKNNGKSPEASSSYGRELEERISSLLEKAAPGVSADVLITFENLYTQNKDQYTAVFGSSGEEDISQTTLPKVRGVMIVCKGIENTDDFYVIKRAVATALAIQENQIYIIGGVTQQ